MKPNYLDWSVVKFHFIALIFIVLAGSGLVFASWTFKDNMFDSYQKKKSEFMLVSQKYLSIDEDEKTILEYYPKFRALYEFGVIGHERRLNWVETLRAASESIGLTGLIYDISPQDKYIPEFFVRLGNFSLYSSIMRLNIDLLHEGDMLHLISKLNKYAKGLFTITECNFLRTNEELEKRHDAVNVKANCELRWLNIRKADGAGIKLS